MSKAETNRSAYGSNGVLPHEEGTRPNGELIVTCDNAEGGLDSGSLKEMIKQIFGV